MCQAKINNGHVVIKDNLVKKSLFFKSIFRVKCKKSLCAGVRGFIQCDRGAGNVKKSLKNILK